MKSIVLAATRRAGSSAKLATVAAAMSIVAATTPPCRLPLRLAFSSRYGSSRRARSSLTAATWSPTVARNGASLDGKARLEPLRMLATVSEGPRAVNCAGVLARSASVPGEGPPNGVVHARWAARAEKTLLPGA